MNPFDLRGPDFLIVYTLFASVVLLGLTRLRKAREGTESSALPPISDPYAIAYLRGGQKAMLEVAAFSLVNRDVLNVRDGELSTARNRAPVSDPVEKAVLKFFQSKAKATTMYKDKSFKDVTAAVEERLLRDGLIPDGDVKEARARDFVIAIMLLAGVAGAKVIIALERGRSNVGFLIFLAIVACMIAYKLCWQRVTKRGEQWLRDLRTLMDPMLRRAKATSHELGWKETATVAAIYGISALPATAYPHVGQMFPAVDKSSSTSTSCGSSCSSSGGSSSSCGSSCGGGGGGCGGCGS
jgi:uncharacterized protein (TIGR04222 family)